MSVTQERTAQVKSGAAGAATFGIAFAHALLDLDRAGYRIHDARKLYEDAIARRFHDTTVILLVLGVDQFSAIFLETGERAGLIRTHQPAIASNIGSEYG